MSIAEVSVVVPVLDEIDHLPRCLDALRIQGESLELIFVDDGSTDGSIEYLESQSDVVLLHSPFQGAYAARNVGVQQARGTWIAFTDADCVVPSDWLQLLIASAEDAQAQMVLGPPCLFARTHWLEIALRRYEWTKMMYCFDKQPLALFAQAGNMLVKRSLFEAAGGFQLLSRGGDTELLQRCLPNASIGLAPIWVRHMEVAGWVDWLRKQWIYGKSSGEMKLERIPLSRSLYLVLKSGRLQSLSLLIMLVVGRLIHELGRRS